MPCANSQPCGDQIQCETTLYVIVNHTPKTKYTQSLARSAIAPQTIASETPAKTTSNRYPAAPGTVVKNEYGASPTASSESTEGANPLVPITRLPSPKAIPKPTTQ